VLSTVIDIPQLKVAINIHDTFMTRVHPRTLNGTMHGAGELLSKNSTQDIHAINPDILDKILENTLLCNISSQRSNIRASLAQKDRLRRSHLATRWGLDQLASWKLSKEFAMAHPEIDCHSGTFQIPFNCAYFYLGLFKPP